MKGLQGRKGKVSDKEKVSITESIIRDNGWNGIYSEKRRIVLIGNEIEKNNKDGIELASGSRAWIYDNSIRENDGVGMKFTLDGSYVWTKKNSIRKNDKSGIEVKAFGGKGTVDVKRSKIVANGGYGIVKDQIRYLSASVWNGLTIDARSYIAENRLDGISRPIIVK